VTRICSEGRGAGIVGALLWVSRQGLITVSQPKKLQKRMGKNLFGAQSGPSGNAETCCPYAAHSFARIQLWGETAMKWSQAICASILVDGFYTTSPRHNERMDWGVPLGGEYKPNLLTPDWGLPPKPFGARFQSRKLRRPEVPEESSAGA
jgi:hypothetical protein